MDPVLTPLARKSRPASSSASCLPVPPISCVGDEYVSGEAQQKQTVERARDFSMRHSGAMVFRLGLCRVRTKGSSTSKEMQHGNTGESALDRVRCWREGSNPTMGGCWRASHLPPS